MNSLQEIETAIMSLPESDLRKLSTWLQDYLQDAWDKQIEIDAKSGKLDKLIQNVNLDIAANRIKPLDEILNNS
ncbi:MAG: hypothetical protein DSM107014_02280 [Gomphosphaeria aponina SAG 52.96 = DSM 107014]|uniref:Uncharacterized protein n=1 Tax=Gomphosphaeria aponina SAG 52.96 = DSM 107014 TaxID=1521640 RepID=A0A941GTF0_9CHRO|nr:hypothetical protein [Gomphosphaeria aponina SAG 52.96 = DSM 107014]